MMAPAVGFEPTTWRLTAAGLEANVEHEMALDNRRSQSRKSVTGLALQPGLDLLLVLREVPPDDHEVELPEDRLIRLACQKEREAGPHEVLRIGRTRRKPDEIDLGRRGPAAASRRRSGP